jgi:hypothetical protein
MSSFDPSKRTYAFLQFEKSLSRHLPMLKAAYQHLIELVPIDHNMNRDNSK